MIKEGQLFSFSVLVVDRSFSNGGTTGCDFTEYLRKVCDYSGVIIGCSGDIYAKDSFMKSGATSFWPKPPPPNETIVQELLEIFGLVSDLHV